jgi:hypothetical protein
MAFEPLIIQKWIYDTLKSDSTLSALMSVGNAPGYQQGIYNTFAPEKDAISGKMPQLPYIVFRRNGSSGNDATVLCGSRFQTFPDFNVIVWDNNNGTLSYQRISSIANRIDTLLSGQSVTTDGITFYCQRTNTDQPFEISTDGRVDYGLSLTYNFNTIF